MKGRVFISVAKELTHLAKGLRRRSTDAEQLIWSRLRAGRLEGMKFRRQQWLEQKGNGVLRFWDNEVMTNTEGVLEVIRERLYRTPAPQSPPLKGGEVDSHTT